MGNLNLKPREKAYFCVFSLCPAVFMQVKYKQDGRKEASSSLYHQLPETTETQLAKELRDIYSEVRNTPTQRHHRRVSVR